MGLAGQSTPELGGFICESPGPGDNNHPGNRRRIEAGTYPLWTQFGSYRSIGYASGTLAGEKPMPALALAGTERRSGISIHPAHPPNLFLSSTGCLNPTSDIAVDHPIDFFDSRRRVDALIDSLKRYAPAAFKHEVMSRIGDAVVVITGEPDVELSTSESLLSVAALTEPASLPISKPSALAATTWLMKNFEALMRKVLKDKPYGLHHVCAIACQETAYKWVPWIDKHPVETIVARQVFDGSGDAPGSTRTVFPINTDAFRRKMGDAFTDMLIEEANRSRRLQGWEDKPWVYKGYGLFQYDLQDVLKDRGWFELRKWYEFANCLDKLTAELDGKLAAQHGDLWEAIRAYNGSGPSAARYRENVRTFVHWCAEITGD